jgi:hypothetical protein
MSAHSRRPVRAEAVLAVYSHARSSRVAEFTFAHPEALAAVGVFVLVVAMRYPVLAAVLAGAMAVGLTVTGLVLRLHEAEGTCTRLIREVQARHEEQADD